MPEKYYFKSGHTNTWQPWPLEPGYFPSPEFFKAARLQEQGVTSRGVRYVIANPIDGVYIHIYAVAVLGDKKRLTWSLDGKMSPEDTPYGT